MPIELRSWINHQPYTSYSTSGIAREAAYFTPVPEPVTVDPAYVAAEAQEYEEAGYGSSIIPQSATWPDVALTASWALAHTEKLKLILAHRPGIQAPAAAARGLATLDRLSGGRTGLHLILGNGADLERDGDFADREQRYARAGEYLDIFTGVLTSPEPFDYDGEFYQVRGAYSGVKPVQGPRPVISLPAAPGLALDLAARHGDVLAFHAVSLAETEETVRTARNAAAAHGRDPGFWVNFNIITGETDEAAWAHVRALEESIAILVEHRAGGTPGVVRSIRENRFADLDGATPDVIDTALYLGLTKLSRANPTLVGSPSTIADAVLAYQRLGVETVSLGSHVTNRADAELRAEILRLVKQSVAADDLARVAA